jgi:putative Mg2+ transporter-C (MgtC) family protein
MGTVLREELADFGSWPEFVRLAVRLLVAILAGALLGYQREHIHKPAGLRTHILVALGAALLTAVPQICRMEMSAVSRVIQGLVAGIGFLGGGAILKLSDKQEVRGLTTAASVWLAAAVGIAAGLGRPGAAFLGSALGLLVLAVLGRLEHYLDRPKH